MNSVRSKNLRLKIKGVYYQIAKDKGIRKFEFVTKTHFLCSNGEIFTITY